MEDPEPLRDTLAALREKGFRAFKIGWGRFGRVNSEFDERIVKAAREAVGAGCDADGGCRRK